ncbi:MAG TPA: hypothetical protein PKH23_03700, partial [Bacillota bacterium]|nr:hypothetical protein [Bacillota bacterium]
MKRTTRIMKGLLFCALCLSMMTGYLFAAPSEVHAETLYNKLTIKSDRGLYVGTDIAAFLNGIRITSPPSSAVASFTCELFLMPDGGGEWIEATSGKAVKGAYWFQFYIKLKNGYYFTGSALDHFTFNGKTKELIPLGYEDPDHPKTPEAAANWRIDTVRL